MTEAVGTPELVDAASNDLLVQVVQMTDVGLVRSENQDFAILGSPEKELGTGGKGRLMVVADGMGGHRGGATASKLAATTIRNEYNSSEDPEVPSSIRSAMQKANAAIFAAAQENPDLRGMGTTCSALVIRGNDAWFGHVGDSRIYMVRQGEIRQLTEDHSLVASMVREGLLTSQEAEVHPRRNVLQRSMGVAEEVEVDVSTPIPVEPGDTFILCSDGLHGLVKQHEMGEIAAMELDDAARELMRRAIERGAPDNVTVIVARVGQTGSGPVVRPPDPSERTTEKIAALRDEPPPGRPMLKWLLVAVLAALIAGALAYWNPWSPMPGSAHRSGPSNH